MTTRIVKLNSNLLCLNSSLAQYTDKVVSAIEKCLMVLHFTI